MKLAVKPVEQTPITTSALRPGDQFTHQPIKSGSPVHIYTRTREPIHKFGACINQDWSLNYLCGTGVVYRYPPEPVLVTAGSLVNGELFKRPEADSHVFMASDEYDKDGYRLCMIIASKVLPSGLLVRIPPDELVTKVEVE